RRVDVEADVRVRILGLEEEQLGDDQVGRRLAHLRAEEDDPLAQEPREDVERALEAAVGFDDHRHHGVKCATHWLHIITPPQGCTSRRNVMEIEREITIDAPPEEVWEALIEPERLEEWFANDVELDPVPGGEGTFRWDDGEERHVVVREVEEPKRLVLDW